jgi:hypothetical protein
MAVKSYKSAVFFFERRQVLESVVEIICSEDKYLFYDALIVLLNLGHASNSQFLSTLKEMFQSEIQRIKDIVSHKNLNLYSEFVISSLRNLF